MKAATGRDSVAELEDLYRYDARLTSARLEPLQDLWPPVNSLGKSKQEGDGKYLKWEPGCYADNEWLPERRDGRPS